MFGKAVSAAPPPNNRPPASEVARIDTNLTQIIVSGDASDGLAVFVNGQPVPTGDVESLTVEIVAPDEASQNGAVTAVLSRY